MVLGILLGGTCCSWKRKMETTKTDKEVEKSDAGSSGSTRKEDMMARADGINLRNSDTELEMRLTGASSSRGREVLYIPTEEWEIDLSKLCIKDVIAHGSYGSVYSKGVYDGQDVAGMDKFVTKTKRQRTTDVLELPSVSSIPSSQVPPLSSNTDGPQVVPSIPAPTLPQQATSNTVHDEFSVWNLQSDPAMRKPISSYHPNDQDKVRRAYMKMGPCQPKNFPFPQKGKCGSDAFVNPGFSNWKQQVEKLDKHVGCQNSAHNDAYMKSRELLQETHHIDAIYRRKKEQESLSYMIRLTASICVIRFLLLQGLAFRGHDESDASHNQGNFLELLQYTAEHNDSIKSEVMKNAPGNNKLTSPDILPVATATVERVFSAMHIVKNRLRNSIGNEWLNNCLLTYIERELFRKISTDMIRQRFQEMETRRGHC
ncbi:hypothetical protein C5167_035007 [Papaver somniferum]|uniref:DUF4371 domain-containing protein n=1 Tax=Papaver somniferum TaxID=3469 RepID=A0A4Y7KI71_PAPSO|nr:hypothetical protein C5167_035007 [Papaver somniferum]